MGGWALGRAFVPHKVMTGLHPTSGASAPPHLQHLPPIPELEGMVNDIEVMISLLPTAE